MSSSEIPDEHDWSWPPGYEALVVAEPRSWLLRKGWRRHGRISLGEVPAANRTDR